MIESIKIALIRECYQFIDINKSDLIYGQDREAVIYRKRVDERKITNQIESSPKKQSFQLDTGWRERLNYF